MDQAVFGITSQDDVRVVNEAAVVTARLVEHGKEGKIAVPVDVRTPDGKAALSFVSGSPIISFETKRGRLVMTAEGFRLGNDEMCSYSKANVKRLASAIARDQELQRTIMGLNAALNVGLAGASAQLGFSWPEKWRDARRRRMTKRMASWYRMPSAATFCTINTVTTTVERTVTDVVEVIKTAAEQLAQCSASCWVTHESKENFWDNRPISLAACEVACLATTFVDMVVGTIEVVTTFTEEVTTFVIYCSAAAIDGVATSVGNLGGNVTALFIEDPVERAKALLTPLRPVLACILDGTWSFDRIEDLPWPDHWDPPGGKMPVAVRVCVDSDCAITIRNTLGTGGLNVLLPALVTLFTEGAVVEAVLGIAGAGAIDAVVTAATAAGLAITVAEAGIIIAAILLYMATRSLLVAGQILVMENGNGVCFHKTPLPFPFPSLGLIDIPVIVTAR